MSKINNYVERGKVNLVQTNIPHVVSVDVRESDQLDVKHLFCGARSLLIDERNGQIVVRGVNKFRDYAEIDTLLINSSDNNSTKHNLNLYDIFSQHSLWEQCQVWALRKMAGFIVTLFALDANELRVMSKHAIDGPHVQIAKRILNSLLSTSEQKIIAHDLFTHSTSVCCECVAPVDDDQHPVMEDDTFHNQLIIFAIQQAHEVMELSLPYAEVMSWANKWKLPCAPAQRLHSLEDLWSLVCAVRRWDDTWLFSADSTRAKHSSSEQAPRVIETRVATTTTTTTTTISDANLPEVQKQNLLFPVVCSDENIISHNERDDLNRTTNWHDHNKSNLTKNFNAAFLTHFAEGVVLVLETNLQVNYLLTWKRPIRVKIKTPCYIALRSLRSLLSGDSHPRIMLFHAIITQWAKQRQSVLQLQDQEMFLTTEQLLQKSVTRPECSMYENKYEAQHQSTEFSKKYEEYEEEEEEYNKENEHSVSSWAWLQSFVAEHGIWWLYKQFVCDMMLSSKTQHQRRWRNATDTVGSAFMELIRFSEATLNTTFNTCSLTVIVMCGLPGSGKSTLSAKLLECAELAEHFGFATLLSRDDITKHVKTKYNITETSSKHKQRRVGRLVHYATRAALNSVIEYTHILHVRDDLLNDRLSCKRNQKFDKGDTNYVSDNCNSTQIEKCNKPGLLIYDACNATRSTRRAWRTLLPQKLINYTLIYLSCDESTGTAPQANLATNAQNNNISSSNMKPTRSNFSSAECASQELQCESKSEHKLPEPNATTCHRTLCPKNRSVQSLQFLLSRMNARANHSVITDSNVAQRALYSVWRKFEPPECDNESEVHKQYEHLEEEDEETLEKCLHFDTRHTSVEKIAHDVCTHIISFSSHLPHTSLSTHTYTSTHARLLKLWDVQEIANMVEEWKRNLIRNLLGDSDDALVKDTIELLTNATTSLPLLKQKRSAEENENKAIVAVQLEISQEEIWHIVSLLLSHVLQTEYPEFTLTLNCEQKTELCEKRTQQAEEQHDTQIITTTNRKSRRAAAMFTSPSNLISLLRRCRTFVYSARPWRVLRRRPWSVKESKEEQNASSVNLLKSDADTDTFACSLVAGHNRWLRGWLLHSNTIELTRHISDSDLPCKKRICKEKVIIKECEEHKVQNTCHHNHSDKHCENAFQKKNGSESSNIDIIHNNNNNNNNNNNDDDNTTNTLEEQIVDALHDRFPVEPKNLHVTLLHEEWSTLLREQSGETNKEWQRRNSHNNISSDKRDALCNQVVELENKIGLPCGARVRVSLNELLINRFAICFGVTLADHDERRVQWSASELYEQTTESRLDQNINTINNADVSHTTKTVGNDKETMTRTPLHMTVATSPRVKAQYCGQLFDLCDQYEKENVELAYSKSIAGDDTVVRSRSKFHNFTRLRLSKPLYVSGKIVHDIQETLSRVKK